MSLTGGSEYKLYSNLSNWNYCYLNVPGICFATIMYYISISSCWYEDGSSCKLWLVTHDGVLIAATAIPISLYAWLFPVRFLPVSYFFLCCITSHNDLVLDQEGGDPANDIFKGVFSCFCEKISLYIIWSPIDDKSTLVEIMTFLPLGKKLLSKPM